MRSLVAAGLIIVCIVLPSIPGTYDGLALAVAGMAQLVGWASILLVPLGAVWLFYEVRLAGRAPGARDWGPWFGMAAITACTLVALGLAVVALISAGPALAVAVMTLWLYAVTRLAAKRRTPRSLAARAFDPAPLYLVVVPFAAAAALSGLVPRAYEFSRNRAMENAEPLIIDIERYRAANGSYPRSLLSVNKDYHPGVMGVDRYHYAPHRDAYNLYFEHVSEQLGIREFVIYNPRDEQIMTSHAIDLVQLTPAQLEVEWTRGHNLKRDAPRQHWKYFWFD
jgi:hypothetical protein